MLDGEGKSWSREKALRWYARSSFHNHTNFTNMLRFTMGESFKGKKLDILDYGGGGGQFALICKSHFPEATVFIADISDISLLEEWKPLNTQIPFAQFSGDKRNYDVIFLNDVFEHVSDPVSVLKQLAARLKPGGMMFIDTPRQFWIYPVSKLLSKALYTKVLKGTVSKSHLQIWSRRSFDFAVRESGLSVAKYVEESEYTMPADFYMDNMGVRNPLIRFCGRLFYRFAKYVARNKIMCVLSAKQV